MDEVTRSLAMIAVALLLIGAGVGASIQSMWTLHRQHRAACEQQFRAARTAGDTLSVIRKGCDLSMEVGDE